jgi:voltage-gated potassium channel
MREFWQLVRDKGLWRIIIFLVAILTSAALLVHLIEHRHNSQFSNLFDAFWWAIVTLSTVGYGDITPVSTIGKLITSLYILASVITVSLITASISSFYISKLIQEGKGLSQIKHEQHVVLLGWNSSGNRIIEHLNQHLPKVPLTMVNQLAEEAVNELLHLFKDKLSFVRGDFTREAILKRANISAARAVIIIPDTSTTQSEASLDERNLLAVLTVKAIAHSTNVVVYSHSLESRPHLKRAGADAVITPENWLASTLAAQVSHPGINELLGKMLYSPASYRLYEAAIPGEYIEKTYGELEQKYLAEGKLLLGTIMEERSIHIQDILSDDSSYLDDFIRRKFAEAGRSHIKDNNHEARVLPDRNQVIGEKETAIYLGRV